MTFKSGAMCIVYRAYRSPGQGRDGDRLADAMVNRVVVIRHRILFDDEICWIFDRPEIVNVRCSDGSIMQSVFGAPESVLRPLDDGPDPEGESLWSTVAEKVPA